MLLYTFGELDRFHIGLFGAGSLEICGAEPMLVKFAEFAGGLAVRRDRAWVTQNTFEKVNVVLLISWDSMVNHWPCDRNR